MKIFENLAKIEDFSNFGIIEDFRKFAKNCRFLKILFKIEDFSTLIEDFLKIEKSSTFTKICANF